MHPPICWKQHHKPGSSYDAPPSKQLTRPIKQARIDNLRASNIDANVSNDSAKGTDETTSAPAFIICSLNIRNNCGTPTNQVGPWRCAALADAAEGSPPTEWAHGDAPRFSDIKLDESAFILLTFIFLKFISQKPHRRLLVYITSSAPGRPTIHY